MIPFSSEKIKIECYIYSALKKEMPWNILASVIDNMTPTLDKSKEVIRILLDIIHDKEPIDEELQNMESNDSIDHVKTQQLLKRRKKSTRVLSIQPVMPVIVKLKTNFWNHL